MYNYLSESISLLPYKAICNYKANIETHMFFIDRKGPIRLYAVPERSK